MCFLKIMITLSLSSIKLESLGLFSFYHLTLSQVIFLNEWIVNWMTKSPVYLIILWESKTSSTCTLFSLNSLITWHPPTLCWRGGKSVNRGKIFSVILLFHWNLIKEKQITVFFYVWLNDFWSFTNINDFYFYEAVLLAQ